MQPIKTRSHTPSIRESWGYRIKERFLRFFGDLKLIRDQPRSFVLSHLLTTLFFRGTLLHDPRSYRVKGDDMRRAMNELKPGDILVRGFENYVDGYFIPGEFSHVGLYLGKVDADTIRRHWNTVLPGSAVFENDYARLEEVLANAANGEQMVIHSMKDGIFMEDLLNFCRCDYMAAVRFPESVTRADHVERPYSENDAIKKVFTGEEINIAERLRTHRPVPYEEAFPVVFKLALSQLGKAYDFGLDFSSFQKMSCTEFVYYCTKSLEWCSGVQPVVESVAFVEAPGISPDGFVGSRELGVAFASRSVLDRDIIGKIKARYPGPYGGGYR